MFSKKPTHILKTCKCNSFFVNPLNCLGDIVKRTKGKGTELNQELFCHCLQWNLSPWNSAAVADNISLMQAAHISLNVLFTVLRFVCSNAGHYLPTCQIAALTVLFLCVPNIISWQLYSLAVWRKGQWHGYNFRSQHC